MNLGCYTKSSNIIVMFAEVPEKEPAKKGAHNRNGKYRLIELH